MSIAITLGVTTPETTCNEMAAGLEPESIEASPAVNEKSYSSHSRGNTPNYGPRGLPYAMQQSSVVCCQDHNYGAPPPPTPPASPLSQSVFTHANRNGVLGSQNCFPSNEVGHSADSESSLEGSDMVVEGTVRPSWCQCCLMQDGFLLKCEGCRGLEKKGLDAQRRKNENISVGESSGTESGDEDMSPSAVSYTATQHTPTSITLTVKRVKRSKVKKRKKSTEKTRTTTKAKKLKDYREGSRKSMRMKNSVSEASIVDENTTDGWDTQIRQWTNQYEEALANQYSADVQMLLEHYRAKCNFSPSFSPVAMDTINRTELACNNIVLSSQMQLQLGRVTRVQKNNKILRAARDLDAETLIIEYRGKVMLRQQFEVNGHFFKKPYPFVLFYSNFNEVEMCVDARTFGNEARFVRRSCTPNAVVRHKIVEGMIHLCIYAVSPISKDSEVTIGFDYEFNSCNYKVDCACHKGSQDCPVQRHNLSPFNPLSSTHSSPLPGAETRKRQTRRKEKEADKPVASLCNASKPNDTIEPQGISNTKDDSVLESVKLKNGEELDENGADATVDSEKPASTHIPASKSQQCRTSKPRPKSRISRYRSSSNQRARRQRQALFQQNVAEGVVVGSEEGSQGAGVKEHNQGGAASPHLQDGEQYGVFAGMANKANARYPKTKKYLVTEWLSDKVSEPLEESPLRITTDPTVLATTLNMLPGLSHLSLICTTPKHYVRFGSPFNPERRRRPFVLDPAYGSCKKRWMKQALDESMLSGLLEDGTASNSSQKSDTSSSLPFRPELTGPFKKRKHSSETTSAPSDLLFQPLSPISPPLPSDLQTPRPLSTPSSLYLGREMENATLLSYSPLTSLPPSRCNTPLQFENISSPETSPVHRSESLTPEPCFHIDSGPRVSAFPDLSSWSSPASVCDEFLLDGYGCGLTRSSAPPPPTLCDSSSAEPQNLRTEFNLIYTCSPLNASLPAAPANDKHFPQSEGVQTSTDSTSQGLSTETGSGSLSLYLDSQMGSGYSEIGTSPLQINPPQKKKVSLLEYRNRKRGPQDPDSLHPPAYHSQPSASLHNSPEHLSPPRLHTQTTVLSRPESNHRTLSTSAGQFREGLGSNANLSVNCAFTRTNVGMNDQTSSCVKDMVKIETPPSASCPPKLLPASSSTRPAESVTQCLLHMDSTAHHHSQRADSTSRHFSAPTLQHYSQRNLQGAAIWTPSGTY